MKVWFGGYTSHDSKGIYTANVEKMRMILN